MATEKQIEKFKKSVEEHRKLVIMIMEGIITMLRKRAFEHDASKLKDPEMSIMAESLSDLEQAEYGSDEYFRILGRCKPAIDCHYDLNSHHPDHYVCVGINGMNILDLVEMLVDWYAQAQSNKSGSFKKSIDTGVVRFDISDQLFFIISNSRKILDCAAGRNNATQQ